MPASLQEVKRRIESFKNYQWIPVRCRWFQLLSLVKFKSMRLVIKFMPPKFAAVSITHLSKSHLLDSVNTTSKNSDGKVNT